MLLLLALRNGSAPATKPTSVRGLIGPTRLGVNSANLLPAETSVTLSRRVCPHPRQATAIPRLTQVVVSMTLPSDLLARQPVAAILNEAIPGSGIRSPCCADAYAWVLPGQVLGGPVKEPGADDRHVQRQLLGWVAGIVSGEILHFGEAIGDGPD